MDTKDLNAQAERYKKEMMRLYGRRRSDEEPVPQPEAEEQAARPEDEEIFGVDEDAPDDTAYAPHSDDEVQEGSEEEEDFNSRYPEPDLSDLGDAPSDDKPPVYASEESLGSATGYILVNVRTADEASPVEGAAVLVTAVIDGSRMILASGLTDSSGTTRKISVPVPEAGLSQAPSPESRPYNLFDVSVTASGFFNARSVDVPVFAGITSVQNFSMIPVPSMMSSDSETMTYYNQEPTPFPYNE
ncbi:MAG: carboxypeptidase regulatory-like domain-containing protein [Ruminococcus sp.]|nr:carboxypeptidase regulatory-like domain-containing protein [Ruminococcus sp.]